MTDILFLTTHNLATNPRLVKELQLAIDNGFACEVIYFELFNWSRQINAQIKHSFEKQGVQFYKIDTGKKNLSWAIASLRQRLLPFQKNTLADKKLAFSFNKYTPDFIELLESVSQPRMVIGRTTGCLYPLAYAANKFSCACGFDMEDYHPGETNNEKLAGFCKEILSRFLGNFSYVSHASFPIMEKVMSEFNSDNINFVVNNVFPSCEFTEPQKLPSGRLKFVWFSQNINHSRGLELFIPLLNKMDDVAELHLYGALNRLFFNTHLKGIPNVYVHSPISQQQLHIELSMYDVGLALEPGKDLNNHLAVSNKLWAYLQSGLFVLATNTIGQKSVIANSEGAILIENNTQAMFAAMEELVKQKETIRQQRKKRYEKMQAIGWEMESSKLLSTWKKFI